MTLFRKTAILLFPVLLLACALSFLFIVNGDAASAEEILPESFSFIYDGETHILSPNMTEDADASYFWTKGEETISGFSLSLKNVFQSGVYTFTEEKNDVVFSSTVSVTVTPRPVSFLWKTGVSSSSSLYDSENPFVYNGFPQIVYPHPINVVSGEKLSAVAIGNSNENAGSFTARVLSLRAENDDTIAENYAVENAYFSYDILPAPLTVKVENETIFYSDPLENKTTTFVGVMPGDEIRGTVTTNYSVGCSVGTYDLSFACEEENYDVTVESGTLTVLPKPVFVTFEDGEAFYGDEPDYSYTVAGANDGFFPTITLSLSDTNVGKQTMIASCDDENFSLSYETATVKIKPRKIRVTIEDVTVLYGDEIVLDAQTENGSLAFDDKIDDLHLSLPLEKPTVGTYVVRAKAENENYDAAIAPFRVTVAPRPVRITLYGATSVYGNPLVYPGYDIDGTLAYDDKIRDLKIYPVKEQGMDVGSYALTAAFMNENYEAISNETTYVITKRNCLVTVDVPTRPLYTGEPLIFDFSKQGEIGGAVEVEILYAAINEKGLTDKAEKSVSSPGRYALVLNVKDPTVLKNYNVEFMPGTQTEFIVYGEEEVFDGGVKVKLQGGYDQTTVVSVKEKDVSDFVPVVSEQISLQEPTLAFDVNVQTDVPQKMTVSVPVSNDSLHYTAALVCDDKVTYAPCKVENGYAEFTVSAESRTVVLMADKDGFPFALAAAFLLVFIFAEVVLLVRLLRRYRGKKSLAYAFMPLLGSTLGASLGGIYFFLLACLIEGLASLGLLVAILVLNAKINRLAKKGK